MLEAAEIIVSVVGHFAVEQYGNGDQHGNENVFHGGGSLARAGV